MKKIFLAIAIVFMMSFGAKAQSDGFFRDGESSGGRTGETMPNIPQGAVGTIQDTNAPLGSGLLILTALGAGYLIRKKEA